MPDPHLQKHPKLRAKPFKDPAKVPPAIQLALRQAMMTEKVPTDQYDDLLWILAQESEGNIGIHNGQGSTARGLFQLLKAQYHFYPKGEASFGNAVEECQGGIRYIVARFHNAAAARKFWERHHWY
ncbi:hypothetical protein [Sphingomonas bacterium]|uniref:aggregation-promoting factor C-terminal-like domain-containing protein n=1 Tax=Sphingomonas bacterium TaxID=1895847 RepID=UPI001C2D514C|nr:hypothetical protein [Sphingomonas bacterium]